MEIKDGFRKWDNPVRMKCSSESSSRASEEVYPGSREYGCQSDAHFIKVENGVVAKFYCFRHGKEQGA